jgi:DNA-cytosine methyltransferase
MNVLSLFDGMSCGQIALEKADINVDRYASSEINKHAIKITQKNYPKTEQLGDVKHILTDDLMGIDLLIGGSPCQDLSNVNVYSKNKSVNGGKSSLFWEYVRVLNDVNPKYFLLENVGSAKKTDIDIINKELGVEGVSFNSVNLTPQYRNRVYWTNIPFDFNFKKPQPSMKTLLQKNVNEKYYLSEKMRDYIMSKGTGGWQSGKLEIDLDIARPLTATMHKMHRADTDNYVTGIAPLGKTNIRRLTPIECERLMGVPDNYTEGVSDTQRYMMLGNGWSVDIVSYIFKGMIEKREEKIIKTWGKQQTLF